MLTKLLNTLPAPMTPLILAFFVLVSDWEVGWWMGSEHFVYFMFYCTWLAASLPASSTHLLQRTDIISWPWPSYFVEYSQCWEFCQIKRAAFKYPFSEISVWKNNTSISWDTFQRGDKLTTLELWPKVYDTSTLFNTNPLNTHKLNSLIFP